MVKGRGNKERGVLTLGLGKRGVLGEVSLDAFSLVRWSLDFLKGH